MKKFFLMMIFIIAGVTYMHAQQTYTTAKQTTVTTEKYNKNKIIALQWANLRIESYSKFLQVYQLDPQTREWKQKQYIPRDTPKTYRFEKTWIADEYVQGRFMTHTIVVTITGANEAAGVMVTFNGQTKEAFSLKP